MTRTKFTTGAFVFTRVRGLQPHDPDDLQPLASRHGLPNNIIPAYAGDRVVVSRAISNCSRPHVFRQKGDLHRVQNMI